MIFVDIKNDIAFRKIFGNDEKTAPLISFLNAALQLEGNDQVESVTLVNPYQFPRLDKDRLAKDDTVTGRGALTVIPTGYPLAMP